MAVQRKTFLPAFVLFGIVNGGTTTQSTTTCDDTQAPLSVAPSATCGSRWQWLRSNQGYTIEAAKCKVKAEEPVKCDCLTCTQAPATTTTQGVVPPTGIHVVNRKIFVNGAPLHMKGVNWNPVPKGGQHPQSLDFSGFVAQDSQLMADAGINVVRTYEAITDTSVLDALWSHGIYVINTVYVWGGAAISTIAPKVAAVKNHPAILMWAVGNEWNYVPRLYVDMSFTDARARVREAVREVKKADSSHPVSTVYGELPSSDTISYLSDVDVWGLNVYRGIGFGDLFQRWALLSGLPMYLGEYGADAYDATINQENQAAQAHATTELTESIVAQSSVTGGVCSGGLIFEFADEWWKFNGGSPSVHDIAGTAAPGGGPYPDNTFNEEWWGLVDIDRSPRQAYIAYANIRIPSAPSSTSTTKLSTSTSSTSTTSTITTTTTATSTSSTTSTTSSSTTTSRRKTSTSTSSTSTTATITTTTTTTSTSSTTSTTSSSTTTSRKATSTSTSSTSTTSTITTTTTATSTSSTTSTTSSSTSTSRKMTSTSTSSTSTTSTITTTTTATSTSSTTSTTSSSTTTSRRKTSTSTSSTSTIATITTTTTTTSTSSTTSTTSSSTTTSRKATSTSTSSTSTTSTITTTTSAQFSTTSTATIITSATIVPIATSTHVVITTTRATTTTITKTSSIGGTCYISECGCPGSFQETWCSLTHHRMSGWCEGGRSACENHCSGNWCPSFALSTSATPSTTTTTTRGVPGSTCYISECGCPGSFQESWCSLTHHRMSGWCEGGRSQCESNCNGKWCPTFGGRRLDIVLGTVIV